MSSTRDTATREPPVAETEPEAPVHQHAGPMLGELGADAARALLVDPDVELVPGQLQRTAFMDRLGAAVERVATEELAPLGRTARECPYITRWVAYYRSRPAAHIERAIRAYTGTRATSVDELHAAVVERVRQAVRAWRHHGTLELPLDVSYRALVPSDGGPAADPLVLQAQLGPGERLEPSVRARMEPALGASLDGVVVHRDARAGALARQLDASAFTVGRHVAFAPDAWRPGTLAGDVRLAHELGHALQQAHVPPTPTATSPALERNADAVGLSAALRLRGNTRVPARRATAAAGLSLQRCSTAETAPPVEEPDLSVPDTAETTMTELEGLEDAFSTHLMIRTLQTSGGAVSGLSAQTPEAAAAAASSLAASRAMGEQLDTELSEAGVSFNRFGFDERIRAFVRFFQHHAAQHGLAILNENEQLVQGELDRYGRGGNELGTALRPYRAQLEAEIPLEQAARTAGASHPGPLWDQQQVQNQAVARNREARRRRLEPIYRALTPQFPILAAPEVDLFELLQLSPADRDARLAAIASTYRSNIRTTRTRLLDDESMVWGLDLALSRARSELGIVQDSIYDRIIADELSQQARLQMLRGIFVGVLAIGLGVLSGGTGTLAVLAGVGGAALSVGSAIAHVSEYRRQAAAAGTAFDRARALSSEQPSLFWLALDIAFAVVDVSLAARAFSRLGSTAARLRPPPPPGAPPAPGAAAATVDEMRATARSFAQGEPALSGSADTFAEAMAQSAQRQLTRQELIAAAEHADSAAVQALRALLHGGDDAALGGLLRLNEQARSLLVGLFRNNRDVLTAVGRLVDSAPEAARAIEGLGSALPRTQFQAVIRKYFYARRTVQQQMSMQLLRAAGRVLTPDDYAAVATAFARTRSAASIGRNIGGQLIERIAARLPTGPDGLRLFREISTGLHGNQAAQIFEQWSARAVFGRPQIRFSRTPDELVREAAARTPPVNPPPHFAPGARISSDDLVPHGSGNSALVDYKNLPVAERFDPSAVDQLSDYAELIRMGARAPDGSVITHVQYIFSTQRAAEVNAALIRAELPGAATIRYFDATGVLQTLP